jgi:hypothetical protein
MVSCLRNKLLALIFGLALLSSLNRVANASQFSTVTFTYGYIWGSFDVPEEAQPVSTVTCNLTIGAYVDVNIYNVTLEISGFTGERWQTLHTEQILSHYMAQGANLTKQIVVTLPQNTSERLHYVIEASTDKGFGKTAFYETYVRTVAYNGLLSSFETLLDNYTAMQTSYSQLLANYGSLNVTYNSLVGAYNATRASYDLLNSSYQSLLANYSSLASIYESLLEHYDYVKKNFDASNGELSVVRILTYVFSITTVIFAATTLYFRRKAPYIVLRKETAVKPNDEQG